MLKVWRKVLTSSNATEPWEKEVPPERSRGEVVVQQGVPCEGCNNCVGICPTKAIKLFEGSPIINHKACIFCGLCVEACKVGCLRQTSNYKLATLSGSLGENTGSELKKKIRRVLGRSLHIRHLDIGSCNGCDFEMNHVCNPIYDIQQYGIDFVASPRHADLLMVTGPVTRNSYQALMMTYEATPAPKLVMALGACACSGDQIFGESYAIRGTVDSHVPVDIYVPGCPPRPQAIIYGLMLALDRI